MKPHETTAQCVERKLGRKLRLIRVARGEEPADIVFKNATYLNVFSNDFCHGDIAVSDGLIAGIGSYHGSKEVDVSGSFVCPGLIDAHFCHHRSARDRQCHGSGWHPLYAGGHRGPAGGCPLYAAQLRARHAVG